MGRWKPLGSLNSFLNMHLCYLALILFPCSACFLHSPSSSAITLGGGSIHWITVFSLVQSLNCVGLCNTMDCSTPGIPVHHQLSELIQTHVHWVTDAIQPSHPLSSPSPPSLNLSQHQNLFQRVSSSHQVARVLEFQLHHQSFQWTLRTEFLVRELRSLKHMGQPTKKKRYR